MTITDKKEWYGEDIEKGKIILAWMKTFSPLSTRTLLAMTKGRMHKFVGDILEEVAPSQRKNVPEKKNDKKPNSKGSNNNTSSGATLSVLFSQELLTHDVKREAFVKVVRDVVTPKVLDTSGSREAKWKWPHVQQALYDSKHIVTLKNKNEFGRSMSPITGCTATSISQTFKRFDAKDTDANIILAIRKVVDDAIANATKTDIVEKIVKERTEVQTGMNPVLKQLLEPILLLEPYYYPNCTKEMVIEGFQSLSRKYVPEHFVDVEKRIRKTSFNFITALQEVRFIRDNVPALEMGFHLKQLYDDLQPMDICRGLMHSVDERLPESVNMLLTQFRFDMQHVMKTANVRPDEVEMTETVAHSQYIEYMNAKEGNLIEKLVRKTLCFSPYFQYYVKEEDVWEMYTRMFKEISLVASVHRTLEENRIDTAVCKVVGVLREVGIIKEGVPTRQLAECFTSTGVHYESIRKAITIGFDRDRMLHDYIYDFWMRKYLPD